jgi:hypothetical protein
MHEHVLVVDHSENLVHFCFYELGQVCVADSWLAEVVDLDLEFVAVVHLDLDS